MGWFSMVIMVISFFIYYSDWEKSDSSYRFGNATLVIAAVASTACNLFCALKDFHYLKTQIGEVRILENQQEEKRRARESLKAQKLDRLRFRLHVASYVVFMIALIQAIFLTTDTSDKQSGLVVLMTKMILIFLIIKSIVLMIYPIF